MKIYFVDIFIFYPSPVEDAAGALERDLTDCFVRAGAVWREYTLNLLFPPHFLMTSLFFSLSTFCYLSPTTRGE